jgi:hypothetical protein
LRDTLENRVVLPELEGPSSSQVFLSVDDACDGPTDFALAAPEKMSTRYTTISVMTPIKTETVRLLLPWKMLKNASISNF